MIDNSALVPKLIQLRNCLESENSYHQLVLMGTKIIVDKF